MSIRAELGQHIFQTHNSTNIMKIQWVGSLNSLNPFWVRQWLQWSVPGQKPDQSWTWTGSIQGLDWIRLGWMTVTPF